MVPGARSKFGALMLEPDRGLSELMYCIEESTCGIVGLFGVPCSLSTPQQ